MKLGIAVLGLIWLSINQAHALTPDEMENYVDNRTCPSDLSSYNDISYERGCGSGYQNRLSNMQISACQNKTDKDNRKVERYNDWMRECRARRR